MDICIKMQDIYDVAVNRENCSDWNNDVDDNE